MKPKGHLVFAAILLCFAVFTDLLGQGHFSLSNYTIRHFTPADGLGSLQTRGIVQDSLGYIWIAYGSGLSRYDGYNFKVYKFDPDNSFRSDFIGGISSLLLDRKGEVWIISELLSTYDRTTDSFKHFKPDLNLKTVFRFCFEKNGPVVWMTTGERGLYSFNTETKVTANYLNDNPDSLTRAMRNSIWGISDRDTYLLLATRQGLWKFDKTKKIFARPECDPRDSAYLYNTHLWNIIDWPKYDNNDVWLAHERGIVKVNEKFSIVQRYDLPVGYEQNRGGRDKDGVFWSLTWKDELILRFDPRDGSSGFTEVKTGAEPFVFQGECYIDRNLNLWSGSEAQGVYQLTPKNLLFHNFNFPVRGNWNASALYKANNKERLVLVYAIGATYNQVWTALPILTEAVDSVGFRRLKMGYPLGVITSITVSNNKLWICSYQDGITGMQISPVTGLVEPDRRFKVTPDRENAHVFVDAKENIWISSRGHGIARIVGSKPYGEEESMVRYQHADQDSNSLNHNFALSVFPEDEKSLWVFTWAGVDLFRNGRFEHVFKNRETPWSLLKSSDGSLLIGTTSGVYQAKKTGDHYLVNYNPLLKKYGANHLQEDRQGRLWLTDEDADRLVCFDRKEDVAIEFNVKDGLPQGVTDFSQTSKGIMVLTSVNGFTLFDPLSVQIKKTEVLPVLTSLTINNKASVIGGDPVKEEFSIKSNISVLDELVLDYLHNNFTVEFSGMEMISPDKNLYRHRLEDYDKDWIESDWKNRTATYTNLDAGTYVFKVKASNYQGIWSNKERTLVVRILPPPWKTWWAYSIYSFIVLAALVVARRSIVHQERLKSNLKLEQVEREKDHLELEKAQEVDKMKSGFFANISHEFRTPITLILGPLKDLYSKASNEDQRNVLGVMMRNGQRLLRLINQLLDLSKLEAGKMELQPTAIDLVQFLREISSSYESMAVDKKIRFFFYPEVPELILLIDQEKMEKVMHNLLSNAFKFTRENGEVILNLRIVERQCVIIVKDTGIGIPANQLDKVFDRFYQVDSSQTRGYEGSGLGMALAKELVELHHGKISVESMEGKGTTFTVHFPVGKEHLSKEEITDLAYRKKVEMVSDLIASNDTRIEIKVEEETVSSESQPVLLIVEDNADMRHYIRKTLSDQYQIMEAENGKTGVKMAEEFIPDLIISDIMMPEMDGYKLCELIKTNETTSHIPVILLTAKADRESKLTGLETGADDYLSKPFDADELKLIVRNRIEERNKMKERFSREVTLEPRQISITSLDEKFITKVLGIIEAHMDDENFSIDELSREAGYSNMHFYRKIKALAGQTPSQFLRTIRLKRAAELLSKNSDNVTQIAYSVGFSSLSYFNKCFKEQFGMTPGQFAEASSKSKV